MLDEIELYTEATKIASQTKQSIGEKHEYYITLEQLMALIKWQTEQKDTLKD